MRPTKQTVEWFRRQMRAGMDPNAKTVEEQWAFVSGFHTGRTGQDAGWRGRTLSEAAMWQAGVRAGGVV